MISALYRCVVIVLAGALFFSPTGADADPPADTVFENQPALNDVPFAGKSVMHGGLLPQRFALIIGVTNYMKVDESADLVAGRKIPDLANSASDAENVAAALRDKAGFTTWAFTPSTGNPYLLKTDIINRITKFVVEVSTQSLGHRPPVVLFYFSGHGFNYKGNDYLASSDFKPRYDDDVEMMGIPLKFVQDRLALINPTLQVVIADACRTTFAFPLISIKTPGEAADAIRPGFVAPNGVQGRPAGKDDRLLIYSTLLGNVASGGSAEAHEGKFAQRFIEAINNALAKTRATTAAGFSDISSMKRLIDSARLKMAQVAEEIQRPNTSDDAAEFVMFPTKADYEEEAVNYTDFNNRMTQAIKKSTNEIETKQDPVALKIELDSSLYCQYENWLFANGISPYSYFGGAALREAGNLARDLQAHDVTPVDLIARCDRTEMKALSNESTGVAPLRLPSGNFLPAKPASTGLFDQRRPASTPILLVDNSNMPPRSPAQTAKSDVFVVGEALAAGVLSTAAKDQLARFAADVPVDAIAVASTDLEVYQFSNLSGLLLGKVPRAGMVQAKEVGGQTPGNESLKIQTDSGLVGYVRQEFVDSGRIAVSFAVSFADGDVGNINGDLGPGTYNKMVVDELLSSSIVIDASFEYAGPSVRLGLARAGHTADYFSKYWTDATTSAPRLFPHVGPRAKTDSAVTPSDDALGPAGSRYLEPNVVKATFVLLPLRKDIRMGFISVNGPSISRGLATDISDLHSLASVNDTEDALNGFGKAFTDACRAQIAAQKQRGASALATVYVQYGAGTAAHKNSEAVRVLLKSIGYGVPSGEKKDAVELPDLSEVRVCPNRSRAVAGAVRDILSACGMGDFALKTLNNYRPCAAVSRGDTVEVWLRRDGMTN